MSKAVAYGDEIWHADFTERRGSDVCFNRLMQIGDRLFKRKKQTPQIYLYSACSWIPGMPKKRQSDCAWTSDN
jgi:hypothetical protein